MNEIIAKINPHFRLHASDYWEMTEHELRQMIHEYNDYNERVKNEIDKSKQGR